MDKMAEQPTSMRTQRVRTPQGQLEDLTRYMLRLTAQTGSDLRTPGKASPRLKPVRWAIWTIAIVCMGIRHSEVSTYFNVTKRTLPYGIQKTLLCFMRRPEGVIPAEDMLLIQLIRENPWEETQATIENLNEAIRSNFDSTQDYKENIRKLFERSKLEPAPKIKLQF